MKQWRVGKESLYSLVGGGKNRRNEGGGGNSLDGVILIHIPARQAEPDSYSSALLYHNNALLLRLLCCLSSGIVRLLEMASQSS